jgi:hypothetical protein
MSNLIEDSINKSGNVIITECVQLAQEIGKCVQCAFTTYTVGEEISNDGKIIKAFPDGQWAIVDLLGEDKCSVTLYSPDKKVEQKAGSLSIMAADYILQGMEMSAAIVSDRTKSDPSLN